MKAILVLLARDIRLAAREGGAVGAALGFYLVVVALLPLGLGPDLALLSRIAVGVLWIALLLAALLSVDRIFHNDHEDGSLELLAAGPLPLALVAATKSFAHWLTTCVPLALLAPVLGLLLNFSPHANGALLLTLLAGTPAISFIGAIGSALTLGLRRGGLLLSLVILPLYVPVLIFGVASLTAYLEEPAPFLPPFLILCAITLVSIVLAPLAAAAAIRLSME